MYSFIISTVDVYLRSIVFRPPTPDQASGNLWVNKAGRAAPLIIPCSWVGFQGDAGGFQDECGAFDK